MNNIKGVIDAFRDGPPRFIQAKLPWSTTRRCMLFVTGLWNTAKVKRTRKQARRILNNMTLDELNAKYAMFLLEEAES